MPRMLVVSTRCAADRRPLVRAVPIDVRSQFDTQSALGLVPWQITCSFWVAVVVRVMGHDFPMETRGEG